MKIRHENEIEDKIKELKKELEPKPQTLRYNVYNKLMASSFVDEMNNVINKNLIHAKIDALKWVLKKKKELK